MTKYYILIFLIGSISNLFAQKIKVLTLGTFHLEFNNSDIQKFEENNQIDVLKPEYQSEIETI